MAFSLRTKMAAAIGGPLLVAYLILVGLEYRAGRQQGLANMELYLTNLTARRAAELDGNLSKAEESVRTLARIVAEFPNLTVEQMHALLQNNLRDNPKFFGMCLAFEPGALPGGPATFAPYYCRDGRGGLRFTDIAKVVPDYPHLDWYRPAKTEGRSFWTEPYFDAGVGERIMCTYTAPIVRRDIFCGVLTVDLVSEDLLNEISSVKIGEIGGGYCMLLSHKGTFISHPDRSLVMKQSISDLARRHGLPELVEAAWQMRAGKPGVHKTSDYRTKRPQWMVYAPISSTGWSLATVLPEDEVMSPIYARLARLLWMPAAGALVILVLVPLMSIRITRPLQRLAAAAESLGRGNLDARVPEIKGRDEIARLAHTFNVMTSDLKTNIAGRIREEAARRQVEAEMRAAREIQASLLPGPLPPEQESDKGFSLHAVNAPAKTVAGDFYDFFFLDDRRLVVVMADVSGKGLPAAMYMAVTRTKLRDFALPGKTPSEIVAEVNRSLAQENDGGMFVTLFFGCFDTANGELTYVNAGHNPPYLVRSEAREIETLESTGPLVGPFPDAEFEDARRRLEPNDLLFLFTDGVTEAGAARGELFGEERLIQLLRDSATAPADAICRTIVQAAEDFNQGELSDDITVLAIRRK
jgi:phosphoserine phosphatase RsbU/P